ncbi:hypothetical protein PTSG_11643 [Salpingoeca rosetta]|uniref:Phosphodiesterase n=1 Tax=Salpingoeca rosetta (strain ATCC 50818 / BSB-021) TaxID=946362 RepID=F2TXI1_SALR5|nr:uncharacterized protein PTSG_11643 [Salpingoeca rosetta]EGD76090.1 hypothetical protein PTSG_11643 [Salpingoeca rosetta]|eukprot:XP_004998265.1 hypothetical protein PTSG_11643 [Salpingoeca rosetta]
MRGDTSPNVSRAASHHARPPSPLMSPTTSPRLERMSRADAVRNNRRSPRGHRRQSPRYGPLKEEVEVDVNEPTSPTTTPPRSPTFRHETRSPHAQPKRASRLSSVQSCASEKDVFDSSAASSFSATAGSSRKPRMSKGTYDNVGFGRELGPEDDDDIAASGTEDEDVHARKAPETHTRQQQQQRQKTKKTTPSVRFSVGSDEGEDVQLSPSASVRSQATPRARSVSPKDLQATARAVSKRIATMKGASEEASPKAAADAEETDTTHEAERRESKVQQMTAALNTAHTRNMTRSMTVSSPKGRRRGGRTKALPAAASKQPLASAGLLRFKQRSLEDIRGGAEYNVVDEDTRIDNLDRFKKHLAAMEETSIVPLQKKNSDVMELLLRSDRWDLDIFKLESATTSPLTWLGLKHICDRRLNDKLPINIDTCARFFHRIERMYKPHPVNFYHTNTHGADVLHVMACLLDSVSYFTPTEAFAAIVAAGVHDVGHPGYTNSFLMKTGNDLAVLYNDRSVLENFHAATTFQLMKEHPDCDILAHFKPEEKKTIRRLIIDMVLGTDMTLHKKHIETFMSYSSKSASLMEEYEHMEVPADILSIETTLKDRSFVLEYMLHCADLSACTKPWNLCYRWAYRVLNEFWLEGDEEKRRKLPVGDLNDRDAGSVPAGQYGFLRFVCHPLWKEWNDFVSPDVKGIFMTNLESNMALWEARKEYELNQRDKTQAAGDGSGSSGSSSPSKDGQQRQSGAPDKNKAAGAGNTSDTNGRHGGKDSPAGPRKLSRGEQAAVVTQSKNLAVIPRRRSQPLVRMDKMDEFASGALDRLRTMSRDDDDEDEEESASDQEQVAGKHHDSRLKQAEDKADGGTTLSSSSSNTKHHQSAVDAHAHAQLSDSSSSTSSTPRGSVPDGAPRSSGGAAKGRRRGRRPQRQREDSQAGQAAVGQRPKYAVELEMEDGVAVYTTEV